jgi:hypothetical protein
MTFLVLLYELIDRVIGVQLFADPTSGLLAEAKHHTHAQSFDNRLMERPARFRKARPSLLVNGSVRAFSVSCEPEVLVPADRSPGAAGSGRPPGSSLEGSSRYSSREFSLPIMRNFDVFSRAPRSLGISQAKRPAGVEEKLIARHNQLLWS